MTTCDIDSGGRLRERLRRSAERLGFSETEIAELLRVYVTVPAKARDKAKGLAIDDRFAPGLDNPEVLPPSRANRTGPTG